MAGRCLDVQLIRQSNGPRGYRPLCAGTPSLQLHTRPLILVLSYLRDKLPLTLLLPFTVTLTLITSCQALV